MSNRFLFRVTVQALLSVSAGLAHAQVDLDTGVCGNLHNAYGPYDYRTRMDKIRIVELYHFDSGVATLTKSKGTIFGGDLDYTLRASPNHHRALMTMVELVRREKTTKPRGSRYTIDCWFNRAERFSPDDAMVKTIYGLYLVRSGRTQAGVEKLETARKLDARNANVSYNLGLAYVELKQYDKALESAHAAYRMGFPLPGLREKLRRVGQWRELPESKASVKGGDGSVLADDRSDGQPVAERLPESRGSVSR